MSADAVSAVVSGVVSGVVSAAWASVAFGSSLVSVLCAAAAPESVSAAAGVAWAGVASAGVASAGVASPVWAGSAVGVLLVLAAAFLAGAAFLRAGASLASSVDPPAAAMAAS